MQIKTTKTLWENIEKDFNWYLKKADEGDPIYQTLVGLAYNKGKGVEENKKLAFEWWLKAAEQGDAKAQTLVGSAYSKGDGVKENKKLAFEWWLKAAEQGDEKAQTLVGVAYSKGEGIEKNRRQAVEWWLKAAEQNYDRAQTLVGLSYFNGKGVEEDKKLAFEWWLKAAEQNYDRAQTLVGLSYFNGKGVEEDKKLAVEWWLKAAEQGNPIAQGLVGLAYFYGKGVEENKERAFYWCQKPDPKIIKKLEENNIVNYKYCLKKGNEKETSYLPRLLTGSNCDLMSVIKTELAPIIIEDLKNELAPIIIEDLKNELLPVLLKKGNEKSDVKENHDFSKNPKSEPQIAKIVEILVGIFTIISILFGIYKYVDNERKEKYKEYIKDRKIGNLIWSDRSLNGMDWFGAKEYCEDLSEGGFNDWRLPTIGELRTLIQNCEGTETGGKCGVTNTCLSQNDCKNKACKGCEDKTVQHSKLGDKGFLWSSSFQAESSNNAWYIDFTYAGIHAHSDGKKLVRCVRNTD